MEDQIETQNLTHTFEVGFSKKKLKSNQHFEKEIIFFNVCRFETTGRATLNQ